MSDNEQINDLAAERKSKPDLPELYTDTLMDIFRFSPTTLEMNRRRMLSNQQKDHLKGSLKEEADGMWLLLMIMLGVTVLLAVIFSIQGMAMAPLIVGAGLIILPFMWLTYKRQTRLRQDVEHPELHATEGPLVLRHAGMLTAQSNYTIQIGDKRFNIDADAYAALTHYETPYVRAYYTGNSDVLLSAEVIPHPQNDDKQKNEEKLKHEEVLLVDESELDDATRSNENIEDAQFRDLPEDSTSQKTQQR